MFKLFENGVHVVGTQAVSFIPKTPGKKGKVLNFSRKSSRNLRDLCSRLETRGKFVLAITLTIPPIEDVTISWYNLVKRYRENLRRRKLGAIWRVELQRHNMPHLHMIATCQRVEDGFTYWSSWVDACDKTLDQEGLPITSHKGFLEYAVRVRLVRDKFRWMPYLIGHTSKHKHAQLGWQGRQWGVFNRSHLSFQSLDTGDILRCSDKVGQIVMRTIRRRYSQRIRQYGANGTSILNINPHIVQRLMDYYSVYYDAKPPF